MNCRSLLCTIKKKMTAYVQTRLPSLKAPMLCKIWSIVLSLPSHKHQFVAMSQRALMPLPGVDFFPPHLPKTKKPSFFFFVADIKQRANYSIDSSFPQYCFFVFCQEPFKQHTCRVLSGRQVFSRLRAKPTRLLSCVWLTAARPQWRRVTVRRRHFFPPVEL